MASFILITGPEGAGKTTSIRFLGKYLEKHGYFVLRVYIRSTFFPIRILRKFLILVGRRQILCKPDNEKIIVPDNEILHKIVNMWYLLDTIIAYVYVFILLIIIKFLNILRKRIIILAERFLLDTMVDFLYGSLFYKPSKSLTYILVYMLMKLISYIGLKHSFTTIILDANYKELLRRYVKRKYSEFLEYVKFQKVMVPKLLSLINSYNIIIASKNIDTSNLNIIETLKREIKFLYLYKAI